MKRKPIDLRPCWHSAKFLFVLQKEICQQEAILSASDFFHLPKFSQLSPNLKDVVENIWRPNFSQETKSFVPGTLRWVILFREDWRYWLYEKISLVSDVNKIAKTKKIVIAKFSIFFANDKLSFSFKGKQGLILDIRHFCMRFRIDGKKPNECHVDFQGANKWRNLPIRVIMLRQKWQNNKDATYNSNPQIHYQDRYN